MAGHEILGAGLTVTPRHRVLAEIGHPLIQIRPPLTEWSYETAPLGPDSYWGSTRRPQRSADDAGAVSFFLQASGTISVRISLDRTTGRLTAGGVRGNGGLSSPLRWGRFFWPTRQNKTGRQPSLLTSPTSAPCRLACRLTVLQHLRGIGLP